MGRFSDQWVIDKTLFEFIAGGSCACCGFAALFAPGGLAGMIQACSDIETDAAKAELDASARSPWPPEMRDDVWAGRVKLRLKMKREMKRYNEFFNAVDLNDCFIFCMDTFNQRELVRMFQMPKAEISEIMKQYDIHGPFAAVLSAVSEQVGNFKVTGYEADSKGIEETNFEKILAYDRRGGFILPIESAVRQNVLDQVLQVFLLRMKSLGGPKLLERKTSKQHHHNDGINEFEVADHGENYVDADDPDSADLDDNALEKNERLAGPSFRMDRRIIRLLIAKYWADQFMERYNIALKEQMSNTDSEISLNCVPHNS